MSEQFLATAFVKIAPDIRGFRTALEKEIRTAIKGTEKSGALVAKVKIVPDIKGFRTLLNAELKTIQGEARSLQVPIIPVAGKAAAAAASTAAGTGAKEATTAAESRIQGAATGAAGATDKLTEAQERAGTSGSALAKIFAIQIEAATALAESYARASLQSTELAAAEIQLTGTGSAITAITNAQVQAVLAGDAAEQERLATIKESLIASQQAAQQFIKNEAAVSSAAAATEKAARAEEHLNVALSSSASIEQRKTELASARETIQTALAATTEAIAAAEEANNVALRDSLTLQAEHLALIQEKAVVGEKNVGTEIKQTAATEKLSTAIAELDLVLEKEFQALTEVASITAIESELKTKAGRAVKAEDAARKIGVGSLQAEVDARAAAVEAMFGQLAAQEKLIKAEAKEAAARATAFRGATATGGGLLGVRGATLAASNAFLAGAVAVAVFAKAVQSAAGLEQELNVFQATANATASEMERVSAEARILGADITLPSVGAKDAAEAMTDLAKAGLDVQDSLDGARGTLQLATAAQISNAESTELVASALNSFSLQGTEATRVADLLTGAANEAQGSISDMGIALQQSSAVARQAGLSLEDTVAFITLLAKNGIRGSDAGTSLRTALLRLIAPTDQANQLLHQFGIEVLNAAGNIRPEAFAELANVLGALDAQARNQVLRKIFGQDAIRAAVIFGREGTAGLNSVRDATQEAGLASKLAEARTQGFSGKVSALKNSVENLGISLGKITIGPLGSFIETLQAGATAAEDFSAGLDGIQKSRDKSQGGGEKGFFGKLFDHATENLGETINQFNAFVQLTNKGEFVKFGEGALDSIKILNKGIRDSVESAQLLAITFGKVETPEEAIANLEELNSKIIGTSEDAEFARSRIAAMITLITALGRTPTLAEIQLFLDEKAVKDSITKLGKDISKTPFDLAVAIGEKALELVRAQSKALGVDSATLFIETFQETMDPILFAKIFADAFPNFKTPSPLATAGKGAGSEGGFEGLTGKQIQGRIAGFDREKTRAQLRGSSTDLLTVLKNEQAFLLQQLQKQNVQKQPGLRAAVESALLSVQNDIDSIFKDAADDRKDRTEKAQKLLEEADKKTIGGFQNREEAQNNKILIAEGTESLKDDIRTNRKLVAILTQQRDVGSKKIKDLEARRDFVRETTGKIIRLNQEIAADLKKQRNAERDAARDKREAAITGIELDIDLAVINENKSREVALRKKLIRALEDQIKHEQGNTNKIKELRNEIARQRVAIKEAKDEADDRNASFKALLFAQLQATQGFASNLLSNITGVGSFSGTVGNIGGGTSGSGLGAGNVASGAEGSVSKAFTPKKLPGEGFQGPTGPGGDLPARSAIDKATGGPTKGGQNRELFLLEQIARLLKQIHSGHGFPEAKHQRQVGAAALDGAGGVHGI